MALHQRERTDTSLYERRIRELVGHGECVMGLIDSYPRAFTAIPPDRLYAIALRSRLTACPITAAGTPSSIGISFVPKNGEGERCYKMVRFGGHTSARHWRRRIGGFCNLRFRVFHQGRAA